MERPFSLFWKSPSFSNPRLGFDGNRFVEKSLQFACKIGVVPSIEKLGPSLTSPGCCIPLVELITPPDMEDTPAESDTSRRIDRGASLWSLRRMLQEFSIEALNFLNFRAIFIRDAPDSSVIVPDFATSYSAKYGTNTSTLNAQSNAAPAKHLLRILSSTLAHRVRAPKATVTTKTAAARINGSTTKLESDLSSKAYTPTSHRHTGASRITKKLSSSFNLNSQPMATPPQSAGIL